MTATWLGRLWAAVRTRDQEGVTLVELTVVLLVMAIVSSMIFTFFNHLTNISTRATADVQTEAQANIVLRTVTEDVRAATNIATTYPSTTSCPSGTSYPAGYGNCLSFRVPHVTAVNTSCPYSSIIYGLVGTSLYEDRTDYNASCTATSTTLHKVLASNVKNGTTPLFTFYDETGNMLSSTQTGAGITNSTNAADWAAASSAKVSLSFSYQSNAPVTAFSSTVALRNNR